MSGKIDIDGVSPCWRKDGGDYICDLPELPKAMVVAYYYDRGSRSAYYSISPRSWFPFKDADYEQRHDSALPAIRHSEKVVLSFVSAFLKGINSSDIKQLGDEIKQVS